MSQPSSLPPASPPPTGGGGFLQPYQSDNSAEYAPLATYSVIAAGSVGIDLTGAILLVSALAVVVGYMAWCWIDKWLQARGKISSVAAGMVRVAATRGDLDQLELLAQVPNFDPNAANEGFTALHAACVEGHADAAAWLCARGVDVMALKEDGWMDTALHYAAARGHLDVARVLVAYGADIHAQNYAGKTPEDLAHRHRKQKVATYLSQIASGKRLRPKPEEVQQLVAAKRRQQEAAQGGKTGSTGRKPAEGGKAGGREGLHDSAGSSDKDEAEDGSAPVKVPGFLERWRTRRQLNKRVNAAAARGWEGWGSQGTEPKSTVRLFRVFGAITQFLHFSYIVWRALRTLRPGLGYLYSIPFWLMEYASFVLSNCFMISMWNQIERPQRRMCDMMDSADFPHVDIFIVCYSEPVEVIEPTAIAALNMNWPGSKLTVNILDDGKKKDVERMVQKLAYQLKFMQREAKIVYIAREKAKGVPHHAKAGNINSAILKEGPGKGVFIMVLDCDMIVSPEFLMRTIGHFYRCEGGDGKGGTCGGKWVLKEKAAFIQTPQDFWNVDATDPMVHCARFFYGPMLQGRDGIGVVFRRDILVSIGGQAYGSITEDYNSAMCLMSAGFATMFLNERLVYGMAPDEIEAVFTQRLRWAMGALQILMRSNPLRLVGLTFAQACLFFEAAAHHWLAVSTMFMAIVPIVYMYTEYSPMVCEHLWEFAIVFGTWYLSNRITMWWVHRGTMGGDQELWRGSQMWIWMAPNHIKAIWKVIVAESRIFKWLCQFEITFAVTSKEKTDETAWDALKRGLRVTWPFLLYYTAYAAGLIYFVVTASMGWYSAWQVVIFLSALAWGMLICLCIWPPVATLLPRVETEAGWKIVWDAFLDPSSFQHHQQERADMRESMRLSMALSVQGPEVGKARFSLDGRNHRGRVSLDGRNHRRRASVELGRLGRPRDSGLLGRTAGDSGGLGGAAGSGGAAATPAVPAASPSGLSLLDSSSGGEAGRERMASPSRTASGIRFVTLRPERAPSMSPPDISSPAASTSPVMAMQQEGAPGDDEAPGPLPAPVLGDFHSPFIAMRHQAMAARAASAPAPMAAAHLTSAASPFLAMQQQQAAEPTAATARPASAAVGSPEDAQSPFFAMRQQAAAARAVSIPVRSAAVPPTEGASPLLAMRRQQQEAAQPAAAAAEAPAEHVLSPFAAMQHQAMAGCAASIPVPAAEAPPSNAASPFLAMRQQQAAEPAAAAAPAFPEDALSPFFAMRQQAAAARAASVPVRSAAVPPTEGASPFLAMQRQQQAAEAAAAAPAPAAMASPEGALSPFAAMQQQAAAARAASVPVRSAAAPPIQGASPFLAMRRQHAAEPSAAAAASSGDAISPFAAMQQQATAARAASILATAATLSPTPGALPFEAMQQQEAGEPTSASAASPEDAAFTFAPMQRQATAARAASILTTAATLSPIEAASPFVAMQQQEAGVPELLPGHADPPGGESSAAAAAREAAPPVAAPAVPPDAMALSVPSTTGSRQVAPDSGGDATSLTSSEDLQQLPLPVWKSGQLPGAGPSGGLGASKGSQQLAPGGPSWGGGLLSGIFNTSFFHDHEMCSEAASNIGRVAMPEQTARALAASSLLTSVILPERPATSATGHSMQALTLGEPAPLFIALEGGRALPAEAAVASGASVNLGTVLGASMSSMIGASAMLSASGGNGADMLEELTSGVDTAVDDFVTLTGATPSMLLSSCQPCLSPRPGLGAIAEDEEAVLGDAAPSQGLPFGRSAVPRNSFDRMALASSQHSHHLPLHGSFGAGSMALGSPRGRAHNSMFLSGAGGGLGGEGFSIALGGSRALPSIARHSHAPHYISLQSRPPVGASAEERLAWTSQQLNTLASVMLPFSSVLLSGHLQLHGFPSLGATPSTMIVPVVPETIFEHTIAARPNFERKSVPRTNYMFLLVNGLLITALVVGSVLEVKIKVTGGDHSFSNLT